VIDARDATLRLFSLDGVVFDLDGVVTDTAGVHATAWQRLFDEYRAERAARGEPAYAAFDRDRDYRLHLDGRPRVDGIASFLADRGVTLPRGEPGDPPEQETVWGLGNRKNAYFQAALRDTGVQVFDSTVGLVRRLQDAGIATALISASRNAGPVLVAGGLADLFPVRVDGLVAAEIGLAGKPDPAVFLEAARRLDVDPARAAVVEDALAGVDAGRRGGFALVVGVDRTGHGDALAEAGADVVVTDLAQLIPPDTAF
jgi:beta-phosphoglucomutase family hydrolase